MRQLDNNKKLMKNFVLIALCSSLLLLAGCSNQPGSTPNPTAPANTTSAIDSAFIDSITQVIMQDEFVFDTVLNPGNRQLQVSVLKIPALDTLGPIHTLQIFESNHLIKMTYPDDAYSLTWLGDTMLFSGHRIVLDGLLPDNYVVDGDTVMLDSTENVVHTFISGRLVRRLRL